MSFPVQYLEVPDILPFWQRLPRFFLYPLHLEPLLYMLFLSFTTLLIHIFPALIVFLGILLAFTRYAYKILDQTAMGLLTPDQLQSYDNADRVSLPYKQFGIFIVLGFITEFARRAGGLFFGAALICSTLALPAMVMTLAITRSFWAALNPFAVIRMISAVGFPYLGLLAFLFLLSASQGVLQTFLLPRIPPWLLYPVSAFVAMYFTLIMFNMMGYVIYQYHHLLGVRVRKVGKTNGGVKAGSDAAVESDATDSYAELIASGQIDKALDLAYEEQRIDPENVAAHDRYHKLLLLSDHKERLLSHARRYLALLLNKKLAVEAIKLYCAMREHAPDFEPEKPAQLLRLAEAARQNRDFVLALSLLKGFDKRFPKSDEIPDVYFFAAQTLCENFHKDAAARQILMTLLERYPSHPVSDKARQLLNAIEKLAKAP
jgi:tetratricopeptide (TPR) repeat protein